MSAVEATSKTQALLSWSQMAEGAAGGGFSIWPLQIGSESEWKRTNSV